MLGGKAYNANMSPPINNYKEVKGSIVDTRINIWSDMKSY
jgi:hypothetical protein